MEEQPAIISSIFIEFFIFLFGVGLLVYGLASVGTQAGAIGAAARLAITGSGQAAVAAAAGCDCSSTSGSAAAAAVDRRVRGVDFAMWLGLQLKWGKHLQVD